MKYVYLALGIILFVILMILYFQLLAGAVVTVLFFTTYINIQIWTVYLLLIAILCGTFMTLGIQGILQNNDSMDDGFDL